MSILFNPPGYEPPDWQELKRQMAMGMQNAAGPAVYSPGSLMQPSRIRPTPLEQILSRFSLSAQEFKANGIEFLTVRKLQDKTVAVVIVRDEQVTTVTETDEGLFPSDAFVTKLRMLMGA